MSQKLKPYDVYEKSLKAKTEVSLSAFSFLFSEIVQYLLTDKSGKDLQQLLLEFGYPVGEKMLELACFREKNPKRENKIVNILLFIQNHIWKMIFGKAADGLERSVDEEDEFTIVDRNPVTNRYVPAKGSSVNCAYFIAGIIEGILNATEFYGKVNVFYRQEEAKSAKSVLYEIKFTREAIRKDTSSV